MIAASRTKVAIIAEWRSRAIETSRDILMTIQPQMFRLSRPGYADTYSRTLEGVKLVPDVIVIYLPSALLEDV